MKHAMPHAKGLVHRTPLGAKSTNKPASKTRAQSVHKQARKQHNESEKAQAWWDRPIERMPPNDDDLKLPNALQEKFARFVCAMLVA